MKATLNLIVKFSFVRFKLIINTITFAIQKLVMVKYITLLHFFVK